MCNGAGIVESRDSPDRRRGGRRVSAGLENRPGASRTTAPRPVGTIGANSERAREIGAEVGERTAVAANEARRALTDGQVTAKIKAKMALDDTVKALDVNVDTSGSTVTVSGMVDSAAQRERVLQLARETAGVTTVVDRLRVR